MFVEEIILEGFKTYMNRTVISGFDPQFNAITGLNGSGKSNILDSIQFLLGSTSKQMLRLKTGLTQLIYKEGFAGIQKASVTIKFRCPDKNMRPIGYQNCEELIVTRQITKDKITKFFVNGQNSNLGKVRSMFRSVQLNIQNPHFLVKQGQITKIINLKPLQLLGMIEQTAGTAFYNKTRTQSQKQMQRKQNKLDAINEILQTTIKPQMDKLQIDRKKYAVFKQKEVLADRLNQQIKRHQYAIKLMETRNKQYKITAYKQNFERKVIEVRELTQRLVEVQNQIKILKTKGDNQSLKDYNHMKNLVLEKQNKRKTIKNRLQVIQDQSIKLKQETISNQQELNKLKQQIQWHEKQSIQTERQIQEFNDLLNDLDKSKNQEQALKLIQKQIKQEQAQVANIKEQIRLMESKKQSIKRQSQNQNRSIQQTKQSMQSMLVDLRKIQKEIQDFKSLQRPMPVDDPELGAQEMRRLQNQKARIINENYRLRFHFNDPYHGFDRRLVKGKMFMCFAVKDKIHEKALQIGIGAKINNIIIQNEIASQALIKADSFGPNATIIPNNKIRFFTIRPQVIRCAEQIAKQCGGLAKVAYQLINFDNSIKNSIFYAFSNFIVCSSAEIARKIAFNHNRSLSCKCVTYDGDVFEAGTLTGGSDMNQFFLLPKSREIKQIDERIKVQRIQFDKKHAQFQEFTNRINSYRLLQKQIEAKISRKQKLTQKLSTLSLNTKPRDYSDQINGIQKRIQGLHKELVQHQAKVKQLGSKAKQGSFKSIDQQKKNISSDLKKYQRKLQQAKKRISLNQIQIERINHNVQIADQNQSEYQKQIFELEKAESLLLDDIKEHKIQFQELELKKQQYQKQSRLNQNQIQLLHSEGDQIRKKQQQSDQSMRSMKSQVQIMQKEIQQNQRILASILMENSWLENQRMIEIQPNFNYDDAIKQYNQILIDVDKLRKTVKVNIDDHSYQKLSEQYQGLLQKKSIIQNDKKTLLTNMHELDDKRTKTLQQCYKIVKQNLGTIFNDLLPGATAHLNLIDQGDVTKGAQLRVHFNNIKKELSELSGGQRSLLALSFILALLLYKPSPFYILDQIDSALDLSHTENIGYMISKRFPQSQFLLISLKQGMFQNANVLYKVHFAEGQSKVDRQVLKKKK